VKLRLYFSGRLAREGEYLDKALRLLWELESRGVACELNDTDGWREAQFRDLYREAVGSAALGRYGVRQVFCSGSDGRSGIARYTLALLCTTIPVSASQSIRT
jgi:hypothetical protein